MQKKMEIQVPKVFHLLVRESSINLENFDTLRYFEIWRDKFCNWTIIAEEKLRKVCEIPYKWVKKILDFNNSELINIVI